MKNPRKRLANQNGSTLILAIFILFMLTTLSVIGLKSTQQELGQAGKQKSDGMAFYEADGGAQLTNELIEQSIEERGWPNPPWGRIESGDPEYDSLVPKLRLANTYVVNGDLYANDDLGTQQPVDDGTDAYFRGLSGITSILVGGNSQLSTGGAIQMASGYEGVGKGSASGGAWIIYDLRSRHEGVNNSRAQIKAQWLHVM